MTSQEEIFNSADYQAGQKARADYQARQRVQTESAATQPPTVPEVVGTSSLDTNPTGGIVYILTNDAMPGMIKIGISSTGTLIQRIGTLSATTSIPLPFDLHFALEVANFNIASQIERSIHTLFAEHRVNPNREFFRLTPEKAVMALMPIIIVGGGKEYILPQGPSNVNALGVSQCNRKRSPFVFSKIGINIGDDLIFTRDINIKCKVVSDREVEFNGQITSVSQAAKDILSKMQGYPLPYNVSGPMYWTFEGETLDERRLRLEEM